MLFTIDNFHSITPSNVDHTTIIANMQKNGTKFFTTSAYPGTRTFIPNNPPVTTGGIKSTETTEKIIMIIFSFADYLAS